MPTSNTTIERIYNAAELLFAEKDVSDISLRLITTKAKVNLASVNYHFGSKQGLIEALFSKYLNSFCTELNNKLDYYEKRNITPSTQKLLTTFIELTTSIKTSSPKGTTTFMRLLSGALMQEQIFLHQFLIKNFGNILYRYIALLKDSVKQNITDIEWFWRIHFGLGTILQNLTNFNVLQSIAKTELNTTTQITQVTQLMIPFIVAGLTAKPVLKASDSLNTGDSISYYKRRE